MAERGNRHVPELPILLRDAQPRWAEIEGEADPRERKRREDARDFARLELIRLYLLAEDGGKLAELDPRVRDLCERWRAENGGRFPSSKGGAPRDEHYRMALHVAALQEIEEAEGKGKIGRALHAVAAAAGRTYELVRGIFYDLDPQWQEAANAELSRRKFEGDPSQRIDPKPLQVKREPTPKPRRRRPR